MTISSSKSFPQDPKKSLSGKGSSGRKSRKAKDCTPQKQLYFFVDSGNSKAPLLKLSQQPVNIASEVKENNTCEPKIKKKVQKQRLGDYLLDKYTAGVQRNNPIAESNAITGFMERTASLPTSNEHKTDLQRKYDEVKNYKQICVHEIHELQARESNNFLKDSTKEQLLILQDKLVRHNESKITETEFQVLLHSFQSRQKDFPLCNKAFFRRTRCNYPEKKDKQSFKLFKPRKKSFQVPKASLSS